MHLKWGANVLKDKIVIILYDVILMRKRDSIKDGINCLLATVTMINNSKA